MLALTGKYRRVFATLLALIFYVAIVSGFSLTFRGDSIVSAIIWSLAILILPSAVYELTSSKSIAGRLTIFCVALLLSIGDILNLHYFTTLSGGTLSEPVLNNSDAAMNFFVAKDFYDKELFSIPIAIKTLYRWFVCQIWRITGVSVAVPIYINSIFSVLSVIISGLIARNIVGKDAGKVSVTAMIMTASVCYFINSGTLLLKDAGVGLGVAMVAYSFTYIRRENNRRKDIIRAFGVLALGELLLIFLRVNLLLPIMLGAMILTPWLKRSGILGTAMFLFTIFAWFTADYLFPTGSISFRMTTYIDGYGFGGAYFQDHSNRALYNSIYGENYFTSPIWKKILYSPMSAVIQFITPLPWNFARDTIFGPTLAYAHFSYPWYIVGGLVIYFLFFHLKRADIDTILWGVWAVGFWCVPVYMFGGSVSRYGLPAVPLLVPIAILALTFRKSKSFKIYSIVYIITLATVLVVTYILQNR